MEYTTPIFSRQDINLAGNLLVGKDSRNLDPIQALDIINNWRSAHHFPLNSFHVTLRHRAKKVDSSSLTAQRIKRLPSIAGKLERFPDMKLTQMQDLGGCRAVVKDMAAVDRLVEIYSKGRAKNPRGRHEFLHTKDYIAEPKVDGYRSYHIVCKYQSRAKKHRVYNGLKIEIQIRSKLQHAWATAVEMISAFTGQALKSNIGDESWKRFFKLMSSEIALWENRQTIAGVPEDRSKLILELRQLAERLQVKTVLAGCGHGVHMITEKRRGAHSYLLILDVQKKQVSIHGFPKDQLIIAQKRYLEVEKENQNKPWINAVLVRVDSIAALKKAYPNYHLDTTAFSHAVDRAIGDVQ